MLISYVLPVYNCQSTVSRCIESLLKQTVKGEIIVIDDGSTDNTLEVVTTYKKDINIYTYPKRLGAASCRNHGNKLAKGDIIAVCDCDIYYKNRGEAITQFFTENLDKHVFYSALDLRNNNEFGGSFKMHAYKWDFKSKSPISHPTVAYRKEVPEKTGYKELSIDTDLYEFFLLEASINGFEFGGCQDSLMLKIEGNSTRDMTASRALKKEMYKSYGIDI